VVRPALRALLACSLPAALACAALLPGCTGEIGGGGDPDGAGRDDGGGGDGGDGADAAPCSDTLAGRLTVTPTPAIGGSGPLLAAPTPGGGVVVAWQDGGALALTALDGAGQPVGQTVAVSGSAAYGLAVHGDAWAILFTRGSDELVLRSVDASGGERFETRLLGAVPHDVTGNEWFGPLIRDGRLVWTGSQWAAYYTVQRLWSDGVAHYGDQIRLIDDGGAAAGTIWDWGCSHSMEVRLAHDGTALGPVCVSDCYPEPGGVHFDHTTFLYSDQAGNCSGGYGDHLGGVVPATAAFWVGFSSSDDRPAHDGAVVRVTDSHQVGAITWLTEGGGIDGLHIGPYGDRLLAGWRQGGADRFRLVDGGGALVGAEETLSGTDIAAASDLFAFADGDAGWVTRGPGGAALIRLRRCE
jgi:hypothetical protein